MGTGKRGVVRKAPTSPWKRGSGIRLSRSLRGRCRGANGWAPTTQRDHVKNSQSLHALFQRATGNDTTETTADPVWPEPAGYLDTVRKGERT